MNRLNQTLSTLPSSVAHKALAVFGVVATVSALILWNGNMFIASRSSISIDDLNRLQTSNQGLVELRNKLALSHHEPSKTTVAVGLAAVCRSTNVTLMSVRLAQMTVRSRVERRVEARIAGEYIQLTHALCELDSLFVSDIISATITPSADSGRRVSASLVIRESEAAQ